jgi:hypothetical protein
MKEGAQVTAYNDFRKRLQEGKTGEAEEWGEVRKAVSLRLATAKNLQSTYRAFASLADYDASAEVGKAANNLVTSINGLPFKQKSDVPIISEPAQKLIETLASKLADAEQSSRLRIANESLIPVLVDYHKYLVEESEPNIAILRRGIRAKFELTRFACSKYLVGAKAFEARFPLAGGLAFAPGTVQCSRKDPAMTKAILAWLDDQNREAASQVKEAYEQVIQSLDALVGAHKQLLEDRPLSLSELRVAIADLIAIVDQLNEILGETSTQPST